jgi:hypothetical protein
MNIYRGDEASPSTNKDAQAQVAQPQIAQSHAIAKIAFLTSVFEKLVAEAGLRRERIEQMLAELCEERPDIKPLGATAVVVEATRRAA